MERIIQNKSLEVFGDGQQTRDFVAIQDVIYSIHNAISSDKNGTYNIASGNAVTIKELAELMISLSGKKLEIQYSPTKNGDIKYSQADISSAKDNLRYYPKVQLKEGIKALV
jgi:UDP-glucose 4-epimerase